MRVTLFALLFCLGAWLGGAPAHALDVGDVPNPRASHGGWITDTAGVLGTLAPEIEARLSKLQADTGAELALVILPSIGEAEPREFATALFNRWGVGRKGHDDGVLVLHVLDRRRIEIETGYGAEGALPDAKCAWLIQEVAIPFFRESDFARGHAALTFGLDRALRQPDASHAELVSSARASVDALSPQPFAGSFDEPTEQGSAWSLVERQGQNRFSYLWAALVAALGALLVRVHAHKAFHREKARRFRPPWIGSLVGGVLTGGLVGFGEAREEPALGLAGAATLSLTALGVFIRGLWLEVQARRRYAPRQCSECQRPMRLLGESEDDPHLEPGQATEERIDSRDYDVWACECGATRRFLHKGPKPAAQCKRCNYFTDQLTSSRVVRAATEQSEGLKEESYRCAQCGASRIQNVTLPRIQRSSSSGGGGSRSGGSFGGGRSGGGGAGGSY